ncbi:MAG: acyl carrier protein [Polyangiaceae bacterium]
MSRTEIHDTVRRYISRELLGGDDDGLTGTTNLLETGILDSMAMVELIAFVEQKFNVLVPDAEVKPSHFETLDSVTDLVHRLHQKSPALQPTP